MNINNDIFLAKRWFDRLFEGVRQLYQNLVRMIDRDVNMDWELYNFSLQGFFCLGKFRLGFISIVDTILSIRQLNAIPLISIRWKLALYYIR